MIDVKELRIGNHVEYNGKRKRIDHIGINGELGEIYIFNPEWTKERQSRERSEHTWFFTQTNPIPITAELLTELGFEHGSDEREWHKYIGEAWIGIHLFLDRERMRITVCDDSADYGNAIIRYLHEAENFVFMTLKRELIEE